MATNAIPNPVELSSLPEIQDPVGFWLFGSKSNGDGTFDSGKYLMEHFADYVKTIASRIRTPVYRLTGDSVETFVGEKLTIYYVKGLNVATLKINGADVPLSQPVSVVIPIDTLMTLEITKQLTDPDAHLYIFAAVDDDIPVPNPPAQGDSEAIGSIKAWPGPVSTIPVNWHLCDGSSYTMIGYSELYAALGGEQSAWGINIATGMFSIPNIPVGGVPVQAGTNAPYIIAHGTVSGSIEKAINQDNLPHVRIPNGMGDDSGNIFVYGKTNKDMPGQAQATITSEGNTRTYQGYTDYLGSGNPLSVMQPYAAMNWIIKLK